MCGLVLATVNDGGGLDVNSPSFGQGFWTLVVVIAIIMWLRELMR